MASDEETSMAGKQSPRGGIWIGREAERIRFLHTNSIESLFFKIYSITIIIKINFLKISNIDLLVSIIKRKY